MVYVCVHVHTYGVCECAGVHAWCMWVCTGHRTNAEVRGKLGFGSLLLPPGLWALTASSGSVALTTEPSHQPF